MAVTELSRLEIRLFPAKGLLRSVDGKPAPMPLLGACGGEDIGVGSGLPGRIFEFGEATGGETILEGGTGTKSFGRFSFTITSSIPIPDVFPTPFKAEILAFR